MSMNTKTFNEYDEYLAISRETGERCRTCSRVYTTNLSHFVGYCPKHDTSRPHHPDYYEAEAVLGKICCGLQDEFLDAVARSAKTTDRWQLLTSGRPFPSVTQRWWWTMFCIAHKTCEDSLEVLSHSLRRVMEEQRALPSPMGTILEVRELKFITNEYYNYHHCAFKIRTKSGEWFVFDPTGVQFGAKWPLLSPLQEYRMVRMHPSHCQEEERALGRQQEWRKWRKTFHFLKY